MKQEWIALSIVALNLLWLLRRFYRGHLAEPLSQWFLKHGRIKWAMQVRQHRSVQSGCDQCKN